MSLILKGAVLLVGIALLFMAASDSPDGQVHAQLSPSLSASVSDGVISLTLSDYDHGWWYEIDWDGCQQVASGASVQIQGYGRSVESTIDIYAYAASGCYDYLDDTVLTLPATSLSASVDGTGVSITVNKYAGNWWYKIDSAACVKVSSGKTVSGISGYKTGTHTAKAYKNSAGCGSDSAYAKLGQVTFTAPSLSSSVSDGIASLTLNNYAGNWWYKVESGPCSQVSGKTVSGISGYRTGTYSVSAHGSKADCDADRNRLASGTFTIPPSPPTPPSLSASVSAGAVSLTLSNHSSDWWFKIDGGGCTKASGSTVGNIRGYGQPSDWTMTIKAYSDSGCASLLDTATLDMPATGLSASVSGDDKVSFTLSNYALDWWFRIGGGTCTKVSGSTISGISGYQPGAYSVKAYSNSWCFTDYGKLGQTTFTIAPPTPPILSASVTGTGVSLTLSNYDSDWEYKISDGACAQVSGQTVNVPGYLSGAYSVKAYKDSGFDCIKDENSLAETTFGSGPAPSLSASVSDGVISLTLSDYNHNWWYEIDWDGCQQVASGASVEIQGYGEPGGSTIDIHAYSASDCYSYLDDTDLTLPATSLSALVTGTGLSLTVNNYAGNWWYKIDDDACVNVSSGKTVSGISGYQTGTHTAKAYKNSAGCGSDNVNAKLGQATFAPPSLSASVSAGAVSLALNNYDSDWWFKIDGGGCTETSGSTVEGIRGYGKRFDWSMTIKAYSDSGCASLLDSATLDMPATSLSASVSGELVRLTVSNYALNWWYKIGDGACAEVSGKTTGDISGYQAGTYSAKAYKNSNGCNNDIAYIKLGETSFTIETPAPTPSLSASVSDGAVSLTLSNHDSGWWFRIGNGSCTQASGSTVSGISGYGQPNDWTMTIKAYSDSGCANLLDTATLDMPATGLSASVSDGKVALTLSNYALNWWFRIGGGTCTQVSGDTLSGIAGYQTGTYSVKAYRNNNGCNGDYGRLGETSFIIP